MSYARETRFLSKCSKGFAEKCAGRADVSCYSIRFQSSKYCPCPEQTSVDDRGTPTIRLGETMDFSQPCCRLHVVAWPATVQIILKNDTKCSFFELRSNIFSQRF